MRLFLMVLGLCLFAMPSQALVRIKDVTAPQGFVTISLVGYGLVVGLQSSGDARCATSRCSPSSPCNPCSTGWASIFAAQCCSTRNVAATVIVTADLPPAIGRGRSCGCDGVLLSDATSLMGGTGSMTPLNGPDGQDGVGLR